MIKVIPLRRESSADKSPALKSKSETEVSIMSHAHKSIRECVRATYRARINRGFADRAELEKYIKSISESPCISAREYQNLRHRAIEKFYSEV